MWPSHSFEFLSDFRCIHRRPTELVIAAPPSDVPRFGAFEPDGFGMLIVRELLVLPPANCYSNCYVNTARVNKSVTVAYPYCATEWGTGESCKTLKGASSSGIELPSGINNCARRSHISIWVRVIDPYMEKAPWNRILKGTSGRVIQ